MRQISPHRREFSRLSTQSHLGQSNLARAALLMACEEYPQLSTRHYLNRLHDLSNQFADKETARPNRKMMLRDRVMLLNEVLFECYGLCGNADDYYDPRNSFLNEVLDRRCGIPITLSVIYIAVGVHAGLDIRGVGLPGHFIARVVDRATEESILVDPFHRGQILSTSDCKQRVDTILGKPTPWSDAYLNDCGPRDILLRMLTNLKSIYLRATDFQKTLWVQDLLIMLAPNDARHYRDRGLVYAQLRRYGDARRDLRDYLQRCRFRPLDAEQIESDLKRLQRLHQMLN